MSNVPPAGSNDEIQQYFAIFHRIYRTKVEAAVPQRYWNELVRYKCLPCQVTAYVSSTCGRGYEYTIPSGSVHDVTVIRGSKRIEELFFDLPRGYLRNGGNALARLTGGRFAIEGIQLNEGLPCALDGFGATARIVDVVVKFEERVRSVGFAELFGNRNSDFWSEANAVERAMDEVLQAAIGAREIDRRSLALDDYLRNFKERHVLVLGDFSEEGRLRLNAIKAVLAREYLPLTLDELPEHSDYDLRQKLSAVASVCRFVVIDDSTKSGHIAEITEVERLRLVCIVLRLRGGSPTFVTQALGATSRVIGEAEYELTNLETVLSERIGWAEQTVASLKLARMDAYPWRNPQ